MRLDATKFPLVFLRKHDQAHAAHEAQAQFDALLDRGERFVLLTDHMSGDHPGHDESHEAFAFVRDETDALEEADRLLSR